MGDRLPFVLPSLALVALAGTICVLSFSWLAIGPLSSAAAAGLLLVVALGASLLAFRSLPGAGFLERHRVAFAAAGCGAVMSVGLIISAVVNEPATYLEDRLLALPRFILLFSLAYVLIVLIRAWPDRVQQRAPLVGPAAVIGVLGVIAALYVRAGMNPLDAYREAFETETFKPVLTSIRQIHQGLGGGVDPVSTIRHLEIRGALCASFLGLALITQPAARFLRWNLVSVALAASLALVQFSRANLVIVAIFALGPMLVSLRDAGPIVRRSIVAGSVAAVLALTQIGVVQDALFDRSNNSSEVRGDALADAVDLLDEAMLTGVTVDDLAGATLRSPHNMFLDLALGAGLLGAVAAIGLMVAALWLTLRGFRLQLAAVSVLEALPAAGATGLISIVVVRMLTGGGGLLDPVSWFAFGAAAAFLIPEQPAEERAPSDRGVM